jgi:hypothetical protein
MTEDDSPLREGAEGFSSMLSSIPHMKSRLSTVLKKEFHRKMRGIPGFQKTGTSMGGVIYRKYDEVIQRNVFILLWPHSEFDSFTLEVAVSFALEFPFDILPGDRTPAGTVRSRIRGYLGPKSDGWWRINEDALLADFETALELRTPDKIAEATTRIPALVDNAFNQLQAALPRFLATIKT